MFLQFFYISSKKEKKEYIMVIKKDNNDLSFEQINNILYNKLFMLSTNINENITFNYFEYFYIKKGLCIEDNDINWSNLINIYLSKVNLIQLIDINYINQLYSNNIILYSLDDYKAQLINYLTKYYEIQYINNKLSLLNIN
jgi:hypothetical protein